MFGSFDPALVQQAIQQEQQKNLLAQAQLDPAAYLRYSAGLQGQMIGQGVKELFGIAQQDPRLKMARDAQEAYSEALSLSEGDASSPKFFREFANAAAKRNIPDLAKQAATQAAALESEATKSFQQTAAGAASLASAGREKRLSLAERLVQLDSQKATTGLTAAEENERTALERVVKLQAPKEPPGAQAQETAEAKEVGAGAGQQFTKVTIADVANSERKMRAVRELQVLAGQVSTGTLTDVKSKAQALFKDLGIDIGNPTDAQTLRAAIERGVADSQLEQKGVQTDRDANRYRTASVLLSNTPAANQYIVDYQIALDQRTREKAAFFEKFRDEKKSSVGAERAWNEFIKDKDIFDTPSLSKYKDTFKMNDLGKRVKAGTATATEKADLAALMRQYGVTQIRISP